MTWLTGLIVLLKGVLMAFGFMRDEHLKQEGVQLQAGRDAAVVAKVETAMAKAAADAPDTKAEVITALNKGEF